MNPFVTSSEKNFNALADRLFAQLQSGETALLNLSAEDTLYVRFNGNRVRQNTHVEQTVVTLRLQAQGRQTEVSRTLGGGDQETDFLGLTTILEQARAEIRALPEDPHLVPYANNGESRQVFEGRLPSIEGLLKSVTTAAQGSDLAGLYCGGSVISANRNSLGQNHWFATESFFLDYSLYNGPKAAKSVYASSLWNDEDWAKNLQRTKNNLSLLSKPAQDVKPGSYRTYLAPAAVSEIFSLLEWGGLGASSWKQGRSGLKKLGDGEVSLSPLLSLSENFQLGLSPAFNGLGEVAAEKVPLIENGKFRQFLTSSRTAKEFGLESNAASESESARSLEVSVGTLAENNILKELGTGLYLSNLHYLNWSDPTAARITGMTRYACFWVENGEIVGPIKDLRFDESLYSAFGSKLQAITQFAETDPSVSTYFARSLGGRRVPGMLIDGFTFTL